MKLRPKRPTSKLAVIAVIFAGLGIIGFILTAGLEGRPSAKGLYIIAVSLALAGMVFSFVLGLIGSIIVATSSKRLKGAKWSVAALVTGIFLFIFLPNAMRNSARAKQSEAKQILRTIFTLQQEHKNRNGRYAANFEELGWGPQGRLKYAFYLSPEKYRGPGEPFSLPDGFRPYVSDNAFLIIAVSNLDNDPTLDVWSINEKNELEILIDDVKR